MVFIDLKLNLKYQIYLWFKRIEVLRGPQSTLFGKNASAGVINIVTKKPSFDKSGMVTVGFGNHNAKVGKFYTTGPINETMAYSFKW